MDYETALHECRFGDDRRADLRGLGLTDEQIAELEAVLPICRLMIMDAPTRTDVRDELEQAAKAVDAAICKISQLSKGAVPARREALNRVELASYEMRDASGKRGDLGEIERALAAMAPLARVIHSALDAVPKEQKRRNTGNPRPIEQIDDALTRGWTKRANASPSMLNFRLSSDPGSAFRKIVCICYETMTGAMDIDPERAIKAYIRKRKDRLNARRDEIGIPKEVRRKVAGGRPKSNRKVGTSGGGEI